jgi:thioredoxin reductase/NAD-dependent dihydropyrimidine dehydrogenase PreA subunit
MDTLIWAASVAVVALIVLPYLVAFRRRVARDAARKAESVRLGIDRPVAQFPFVDAMRCIGCAACVDACPEGDVLGIVGGTATVVNGFRCVGHGLCEAACPVGAIEVGLGDVKSREDVPLLDPWCETSVPGLFVAGELGGLALIRNAVAQGRTVAERIAMGSRPRPAPTEAFDVLVVGAGPAGLTAALGALERGLRVAVLEQERDLGGTVLHYPRRKLVLVQAVDLPLGERLRGAEYAKEDLLALLERLIARAGLEVRFGERVTSVERAADLFRVRSSSAAYRARFVVLALGRRGTPRKLGVPGEELPKVMYKLLDAESYRGQRVLVVGGGDSAVEAAIGLARHGNQVTLSYRREKLVRIKNANERRLAESARGGRIRQILPSEVERIGATAVTLRTPGGRLEVLNDYVFVFAGGDPPFAFLRQIGVRFGGQRSPRDAEAPAGTLGERG